MVPILWDGDYVLASSLRKPAIDRIVIVNHPNYGSMIKRVVEEKDGKFLLAGENAQSISTAKMGWIAMNCIEGTVIRFIKQPTRN